MNTISGIILSLTLFQVTQVQATTEIEMVNERTVDGEKQSYIVNALYQDQNSRYTLSDPDDSNTAAGIYLLSTDGGKTAYFIDSNTNSCHQWTNEKFTETLSSFLFQSKDKFNVKTSDLEIEKLLEEPSDTIHGLPTTHIRYALSLNAGYKYTLLKGQYTLERRADYWSAPEPRTFSSIVPLFQDLWRYTGNAELDLKTGSIIGAEMGFQMRSEIKQTRTNSKGKKTTTEIVQYIKTMQEVDNLPADTFLIPDCKEMSTKKLEKKFKSLLKNLLS